MKPSTAKRSRHIVTNPGVGERISDFAPIEIGNEDYFLLAAHPSKISQFAAFKMAARQARGLIFVLHPHRFSEYVDSYTLGMNPQRTVPLFDSGAQLASWNERMLPGEYAVHYSNFDSSALVAGPSCTILGSLADAEEYAKAQVILKPGLRCRIYDDRGFVGPPILEVRGQQYKGESDISPRFRRWCGSLLFFSGLALIIADWSAGFKLTWPATIGVRIVIPGLVLLVTEAILVLQVKRKRIQEQVRKSV